MMLQRKSISFLCIQIGDMISATHVLSDEVYLGRVIRKNMIDEYIILDSHPDDMLDYGFYDFDLIDEADFDLGV